MSREGQRVRADLRWGRTGGRRGRRCCTAASGRGAHRWSACRRAPLSSFWTRCRPWPEVTHGSEPLPPRPRWGALVFLIGWVFWGAPQSGGSKTSSGLW